MRRVLLPVPVAVAAAVAAAVAVAVAVAVLVAALLAAGRSGALPTGLGDSAAVATARPDPWGAWVLLEPAPAIDLPDGTRVTLTVHDDDGRMRVRGNAPCNSYGASVRIEGRTWSVTSLDQTHLLCDPALMDAESAYLTWLLSIERWSRPEPDVLELTRGVTTLTFARAPSVPPSR